MYKLCFALAFLAVAAAKPSLPLAYTSYSSIPSVYPAPVHSPSYVAPVVSTYSAAYPSVYSAPVHKPYAVITKTGFPAPAVAYPAPVAPVVPVAPVAPVAQVAHVAPVAPLTRVASVYDYSYGSPTVFAWKKK